MATTFHDSAIVILNSDGEVQFAEANERYLQNKIALNISPDYPKRMSKLVEKYCEPGADLVVAQTWSEPYHRNNNAEILKADNSENAELASDFYSNKIVKKLDYMSRAQSHAMSFAGKTLENELSKNEAWYRKNIQTKKYFHHLTHAATACYTSPYKEGVCVIIDGYGEHSSLEIFHYSDGNLESLSSKSQLDETDGSLGMFYLDICQACGFGSDLGDEWKVMGLAPYGKLDEELYKVLRASIVIDGLELKNAPSFQKMQAAYQLTKRERQPDESAYGSADVAFTGQKVFEDVVLELLNNIEKLGLSKNLILGGGCMMNSSATGQIIGRTKFESLHVYSAPGDDGNALGAALLAFYDDNPEKKPSNDGYFTPYLGSTMSQEVLKNVVRFSDKTKHRSYPNKVHEKAAELLADGKIIGWVQGRAEFGPRSLGNRSILADPRSPTTKDKINSRIKFREEFRPFAPSILDEFGPEYFENYQVTPYMERTLRFKDSVIERIPGVVHENSTGRLQSVRKEWNERYYALIKAFYDITGVPIVLNTSFNVMGKPIIHSVEDAVAVFYTTGLDALIIDDEIILK